MLAAVRGDLGARMAPEQEGAPEAPRRSVHESQDAHREHALRVLEKREAERDEAKQEFDRMRKHYYDASLQGGDVATAERLLQAAEKNYREAKEDYDRAEKRYQELKEDAQRSTTAGEIHAYHSPSCLGPATPTSFCSDVSILVSLLGRRSPETRRHQALRFRLPLS